MKKFILIVLYISFSCASLFANDFEKEFYDKHPEMKTHSSAGTEFFFVLPPPFADDELKNDKVYIYVSSSFTSEVRLNRPDGNLNKTKTVTPKKPAIFELTPEEAQIYSKDGTSPEIGSVYRKNGAIRLTSEYPVSASVVVDYRNSSEGFTLLPNSVLGKKYVISTYNDGAALYPLYNSFPNVTIITATEDNTKITFTNRGHGGSFASVPYGESADMNLNKGDVWAISSKGENADLSGCAVSATKPVSVITGSQSSNIPLDNKWNNFLIEQNLPQKDWGNEYSLFKINGRKYPPIIRIYTTNQDDKDTTKVYVKDVNNTIIDTIVICKETAKYNSVFVEKRIEEDNVTLSSDKPITVSLYNTGVEEDGLPEPVGLPFQINLLPNTCFATHSSFYVEENIFLEGRGSAHLMIITENDNEADISDEFIIKKIYEDLTLTTKVSESYIEQNEVIAQGKYRKILLNITEPGYYVLNNSKKFISYYYGFSDRRTYAYPAFMSLNNFVKEDVEAPYVDFKNDCPNIFTGSVCDKPIDATYRSNLSSVVFDMNNFRREIDPITSGETPCANWQLYVKDVNKDATATALFRDYVGNDTLVQFIYKAPDVTVYPEYHHYGSSYLGDKVTKFFSFQNKSNEPFELNRLELKHKNSAFELHINGVDTILQPYEYFEFLVTFKAEEEGTFSDSIGIGNDCYFKYLAKVEASVGEPIIEAGDVQFGSIVIGNSITKNAYIKNSGITDLKLYGYDAPKNSAYTVEIKAFNKNKPAVIKPGNSLFYKVTCDVEEKEELNDRIIFHSNARQVDSIAYLNCKAMTIGLSAQSYDFGRKRINRQNFPVSPYYINNSNEGIKLKNIGEKDITIKEIKVLKAEKEEAFNINYNSLRNIKINSGDSLIIKNIFFHPKETGEHKLVLQYIIADIQQSEENSVSTTLTGIGTVPMIKVEDLDFKRVLRDNKHRSKQFIIRNESIANFKWGDTLNIYDLESLTQGEISFKKAEYGSKGYMIDREELNLPAKIAPGQHFIRTINFMPNTSGNRNASIKIYSDASNQETDLINVKANVISDDLEFKGGYSKSCVNTKTTINGMIYNNTNDEISFFPLEYENYDRDFIITDSKFDKEFSIKASDSCEVSVDFFPDAESKKTIKIKLQDKEGMFQSSADFTGETTTIIRNFTLTPVKKEILPGEKFNIKVMLDQGSDISEYNIYSCRFNVNYDADYIVPDLNEIKLHNDIKGKFTHQVKDYPLQEYFEISLNAVTDEPINLEGYFLELGFNSFLPNYLYPNTKISLDITTEDSECINFTATQADISFEQICNGELRQIKNSGYGTKMQTISPNPVYSNLNINFSLAFESNITLTLCNSLGETVYTFIDEKRNYGNYSEKFDVSKIGRGLYYLILDDGTQRVYQTVIIN
jgi:hypothetical protein